MLEFFAHLKLSHKYFCTPSAGETSLPLVLRRTPDVPVLKDRDLMSSMDGSLQQVFIQHLSSAGTLMACGVCANMLLGESCSVITTIIVLKIEFSCFNCLDLHVGENSKQTRGYGEQAVITRGEGSGGGRKR